MMEPIGALKLVRFALCNMFSACTHPYVKDKVLKSFCDPNGVYTKNWSYYDCIWYGTPLPECLLNYTLIPFWYQIVPPGNRYTRAGCDGKEAVVCLLITPLKAAARINDHDELNEWNIVTIKSVGANFTKRRRWQQCEKESPGCQCCKLVLISVCG